MKNIRIAVLLEGLKHVHQQLLTQLPQCHEDGCPRDAHWQAELAALTASLGVMLHELRQELRD